MKEDKLLIKNGRVIDPAQNLDDVTDILIENGKISKISKNIKMSAARIIDAKDRIVIPGIVDMHVHLRQPGREDKETIESGTAAALKGGVTSVLAMPNTSPAIDSPETVDLLKNIIKKSAKANVYIAAAITKERAGKTLADIASLKKHDVVALSDDGCSVDDEALLLEALRKAAKCKLALICHCEDKTLSAHGVINLGFMSTTLGLRGISCESEYKRIQRDILLAEKAHAPIHIAHVSCKESVEIIARAKKKGIQVTAETCPHYFALSQEDVAGYDTNMKMNPPLRTKEDVAAIKEGLQKGIIDVIASDHAPHTINEKDIEFDYAEFGVIGLETELAVSITELIESAVLSWPELVKKIALNPSKILTLDKGTLAVQAQADVTILNPHKTWFVQKENLVSKSKNSAFLGKKLKGVVEYTILSGKIAYAHSV